MLFGSIAWFTTLPTWAVFSPRPKATVTLCCSSSSAIASGAVRPMQKRNTPHFLDSVQRFIGRPPSVVAALFHRNGSGRRGGTPPSGGGIPHDSDSAEPGLFRRKNRAHGGGEKRSGQKCVNYHSVNGG